MAALCPQCSSNPRWCCWACPRLTGVAGTIELPAVATQLGGQHVAARRAPASGKKGAGAATQPEPLTEVWLQGGEGTKNGKKKKGKGKEEKSKVFLCND